MKKHIELRSFFNQNKILKVVINPRVILFWVKE